MNEMRKLMNLIEDIETLSESDDMQSPFSNSKERRILYHGTNTKFTTFERGQQGIYVTPYRSWAEAHYGKVIISLYANVTKLKDVDWDDPRSDLFYDRKYNKIAMFLKELSKEGYNAVLFGGESESMVLFNNIELINAETGAPL